MKPFRIFLFFLTIVSLVAIFKNRKQIKGLYLKNELEVIDKPAFSDSLVDDCVVQAIDSVVTNSNFEITDNDSILNSFYSKLKLADKNLVRIIYYGDSQIEGDHLTCTLREKFQQKFGGKGIGFMPLEMYFNTTEHIAIITNDFDKSIVNYSKSDSPINFGLYGRYFTPNKQVCELRIVNRSNKMNYQKLKLIYSGFSNIEIENEKVLIQHELNNRNISVDTFFFDATPGNLKLKFSNTSDLKIYGLLLDPVQGISLDNVPFRGNLNLMLNQFDPNGYVGIAKLLNPTLVVLHFGLNVIPDLRNNYDSYRIALERDIQLIKQFIPGVSILVIGASDMARKVDGKFEAYPNIPAIIEMQQIAARNKGAAFWDMRSAMGGVGSIINYVEKDWARTDYAHLTLKGTEQIGNKLAADILEGYEKYLIVNE